MASVKCGESQANMFHENGVPESTIHGWLRDEEKYCDFVDAADSTDWMKRKRAKLCQRPTT